jgi:hypothetical protein
MQQTQRGATRKPDGHDDEWGGTRRDARFVDLFVCVVVSRVSNEENQPSSFLRTSTTAG